MRKVVLADERAGTSGSSAPAAQVRNDRRVSENGSIDAKIDENAKLTDCYYEKKDWRACKQEVSRRRFPDGVAFFEPRCCRAITASQRQHLDILADHI